MIRVREQSLCKGKLKARKRENALHKSVVGKPKGCLMRRCTRPGYHWFSGLRMSRVSGGLGQAAGFLDCDLLEQASQILIHCKRNLEKSPLVQLCIATATAKVNLELPTLMFSS